MAETLGMLCDKLTIVRLKEYHTEDAGRLATLAEQSRQLQNEINEYLEDAITGRIPAERLTFSSNKVYKGEMQFMTLESHIGGLVSQLADVNCRLWHEQEKVYEFDQVAAEEKNNVVQQLAILNLERNRCIDSINEQFSTFIHQIKKSN
jgi:dsDNA-specific endonuclease/ATPase MutS2